ncbi:MAG: hypothetical protein ABJH04_08510 [Cyclobacteriaceae bacterium]
MSSKYSIKDHQRPHFITFATIQWVDALSRPIYKDLHWLKSVASGMACGRLKPSQ